jgi:arylsulfatase A-like enzyme
MSVWMRFLAVCLPGFLAALAAPAPAAPPNVVIIFADDLGYGDLGCYGARGYRTPNLDRLAAEGVRFTSFYAAQAVCSASRAALLTGYYPNRIGVLSALGPNAKTGVNPDERTMAEVLKTRGYATAIFGKWHLGDAPHFLPTRHGFDEYFGLPYSNDMWPFHPDYADLPPDAARRKRGYPDLPLIEGERVVIRPVTGAHQARLTTWYTERAVDFIARHRDRPFFLYVPHAMPHVPLFVSAKFKGKSRAGLYADVIREIDWSVGRILQALQRHRLDGRTLVIFSSDNGPWLLYGNHAGSAGPLREGKATVFEGGVRVPFIARWPGRIPRGRVCAELATAMDLLPTLAKLAGAEPPADRRIDGRDIWPLLSGAPGARTPHEAFYYYWGRELQAVRSGPWKLHFPHTWPKPSPPGRDGRPGRYAQFEIGRALFNLESDLGETRDLAAGHPDVVRRLETLAEIARADLGDSATKREGSGVRPPGRVAE